MHFELKEEEHAKSLFLEMMESLLKANHKKTLKILLSCTSGLTTNFFAQKLNEAASTLSLDYLFEAIDFNNLYCKGLDYDVILLAPQISYEYKKIKETFHKKTVLLIPTQVFASYDAGQMITEMQKELSRQKKSKEEKAIAKTMRDIDNNATIFVINLTHDLHETRYIERLYEAGNPLFTEEVIKSRASIQDIRDILDTQLRGFQKNFHIDAVAISMPNVLSLDSGVENIDYQSFSEQLSNEYQLPVFTCHNTCAVAYGYYAGQQKYNIITYHSQPLGALIGGQGTVYKGHLIDGRNQLAGEVNNLFHFYFKDEKDSLQDFNLDYIKKSILLYLIANISIINPEVILIRSALTPDMDDLKEELAQYIDDVQMPDLIYVDDISEYAYLGTMLYGIHELKKQRTSN